MTAQLGGSISCDIAFMNVPLTAEIHRDGEWFVAFCPEVPEANGQGHTKQECLAHIETAWTDMRPLSLRRAMDAEQSG